MKHHQKTINHVKRKVFRDERSTGIPACQANAGSYKIKIKEVCSEKIRFKLKKK